MTHYFSNPLSLLVGGEKELSAQSEHLEAVRTLPSFKRSFYFPISKSLNDRLKLTSLRYADRLLDGGEYDHVRNLLDDDEALRKVIGDKLQEAQAALAGICDAIESLQLIQSFVSNKAKMSWSELYIKAMSGELLDSTTIREALLLVKKTPSDVMLRMLTALIENHPVFSGVLQELEELVESQSSEADPLRSEHDVHHTTLRTTVVAQKVELSRQASTLSKQDKEYSAIINRLDETLHEFFNERLTNPKDLFLNEVLIYDAKTPFRDVFTPRPRFAVERALSSPHDYLACSCCDAVETGLSASQPATAVLYQLYLESGSLINAADLWSAFQTIMADEDAEDEDEERQKKLCVNKNSILLHDMLLTVL